MTEPIKPRDNPLETEPDFCVCDYRPRRKCSVHPAISAESGEPPWTWMEQAAWNERDMLRPGMSHKPLLKFAEACVSRALAQQKEELQEIIRHWVDECEKANILRVTAESRIAELERDVESWRRNSQLWSQAGSDMLWEIARSFLPREPEHAWLIEEGVSAIKQLRERAEKAEKEWAALKEKQ